MENSHIFLVEYNITIPYFTNMLKQQTLQIVQHEPTKNLVKGLPVKEVSKSFQSQDDSRVYTTENLMGLSWILFERKQ